MSDITISGPIFRFEPGTVGKFHGREMRFVRYANIGYLVDVRPSAEAESIPAIMRGTRPDVEFVGRKVIPHAELAEALVAGTLDIDESDFVFIDHSQKFKAKFVAALDDRSAEALILRYATVILKREIFLEMGVIEPTRRETELIEPTILAKLPARLDLLRGEVGRLRRHPFRRHTVPENVATAQTILDWDERLRTLGFCSLVDRRHLSGNRKTKLHPTVVKILEEVLGERVTLEDVPLKHLHDVVRRQVISARKAREEELRQRELRGEIVSKEDWDDLEKITPPCRRTVTSWKEKLSPLEKHFRVNGPDWLLRNCLISGMGLIVERAGQVVIIDEYDADLMAIIPYEYLIHWLGHAKVKEFGIVEDRPLRIILSVMLDAYTGCILGLQIGMTATSELAERTIMMSMMDKTKIARACGAEGAWNQFLRAEKIMHDSGNAYLAYVTEKICAQLRIDKIAAPKAKPYIRGILERVFHTVHQALLARIPGKTFSDPVRRGDYDSQAEAVLTLDDLVQILTVWIVDIYHNSSNLGRDNLSPAELWHHEMALGMGCRPVPGLRTMTHVFGTTLSRKAQGTGIRIMHANYFSEDFARELLRNPARAFRVRWWEENMSEAQVEIRPRIWLPVEVMDPRARSLSVDEWVVVLRRDHIARNPEAEDIRQRAEDKIDVMVDDRVALRRKIVRRKMSETDVILAEDRAVRYFTTPTTEITSDQTHGLYGVPVGDVPGEHDGRGEAAETLDGPNAGGANPVDNEEHGGRGPTTSRRSALRGRRARTVWKPGTME